ncbi:MAG: transglutaminase domain-containing protein [Deltaproteobacteria bacterium]|nr:transglutaminase domain-containing protein [Deltaproteobacteria bacterium]
MRRQYNWFLLSSILLSTGLFAALTFEWLAVSALMVLMVIGLLVRQTKVDIVGQLIAALVCLVGAYLLAIVFGVSGTEHPPGSIGPIGATAGLFFLLVAVTRYFLQDPWVGDRGTVVPILLAVLSVGEVGRGIIYPTCATLTLALSVLALRAADPGRPPISTLTGKHRRAAMLIFVIAMLTATILVFSLPLGYNLAFDLFESSFNTPRTGFVPFLRLGSHEEMVQSDAVVLRVYGSRADHLRGMVYTSYRNRSWFPRGQDLPRPVKLSSSVASTEATEIISVGGERDRYFVPLFAAKIVVSGDQGRADSVGIILSPEEREAKVVRFVASARDIPAIAPPDGEELEIPAGIARVITKLALEWTADVPNHESKLDAIEEHLKQNFSYSLSFKQQTHGDPLVAFLTEVRAGHCEYFASALALLGRALGIPTRVVSGYRVHEYNPLGDYYVVRERNAHSWVEAWYPDVGWRTYDPTPEAELFAALPGESSFWSGLADYTAAGLNALGRRLTQLSMAQIVGAVLGLVLCWLAVRIVRRLRIKKHELTMAQIDYSDPLPALARLLEALAGQGESIQMCEPLEHFAIRLASSAQPGDTGVEAAILLDKYVAWRYGDHGDKQTLTREIDDWVLRL